MARASSECFAIFRRIGKINSAWLKGIALCFCLSLIWRSLWAFDHDFAIDEPDFHTENLLDIKAYQFRKSLDQQWYDNDNGWRMTGGSLDINRLFLQTNIELKQSLSESADVRLHLNEEVFYAIKPFPRPLAELAVHPWKAPIEISLLGGPAYDKRQADLGLALGWGLRPWNYIRFSWLQEDYYYNSKNVFDHSRYIDKPRTLRIEGAYRLWDDRVETRFYWERDLPLFFIFDDQTSAFHQKGDDTQMILDYRYAEDALYGVTYRAFAQDKALAQSGEDRAQKFAYYSLDLYWQYLGRPTYELNAGARIDQFTNRLRDRLVPSNGYDYAIGAPQLYGLLHHDYTARQAWELGTYAGWVKEEKNFLLSDNLDANRRKLEAKLRTSWEYHAADKTGALIFHLTFNLDNLFRDPGDGGGITYQTVF